MRSSLQARIAIGLGAVTALLVLVAFVALSALTRLGGAVDTILRENYRSVIACGAMLEAMERQDSAALFAAVGHDDLARPMLAAQRAAFARAFAVEASNVTLPGEGAEVRTIEALYRDYVAAVDRLIATPPAQRRTELYFDALLPRFNRLKEAVRRVSQMNQAQMERADREARAMARRGAAITWSVGALTLLLALWLALRLPASIARPVRAFADAARSVGSGRLDVSIEAPPVRELAPLAEAFGKMLDELRDYRASALGELHDARALSEATMQCLLDPVVVLDAGGAVALTNEAAEKTFGVSRGATSVPEPFGRARDAVLGSGEPFTPRSLGDAMRWRDRAGERWFLVRAAPLRAAEGDARRVIVIAQDVTRLRRIDELKSDIVATVSHEFKTPLTSLRMATHLLLEPATGPLTEAQREVVTTARDDTERLRALVDEFLDLVRIEAEAGAPRRASVDPRRLLELCVEAHQAIARDKGVTLTIEDGEGLAPIAVDPEKISVVLANLVSNAVRHTPAGGAITLRAADEGDALRVTIRDTGEGVSAEDLARLLERGAKRIAPGHGRHGLGLSIAQEIVLQHGGELRAQSVVGAGSTFTVLLPRARAE